VPADRDQTDRDDHEHGTDQGDVVCHAHAVESDQQQRADQRCGGIDVGTENQRHFVAQDVADDAAEHTGDDAHQRRDEPVRVQAHGDAGADDGEQRQTDGIGQQEEIFGDVCLVHQAKGQHGDSDPDRHVEGIMDPVHGQASQQDVAHGAAANAGDHRDDRHPEQVELAPLRFQCCSNGAHGNRA